MMRLDQFNFLTKINMPTFLKRSFPILLIIIGLIIFFSLRLDKYLTFESLKQHRALLLLWTKKHYFYVVSSYIIIYIIAVAISVPGAIFLTLAGGFLFGIFWGTVYVVISATLGATLLFLAVKYAFSDWLKQKNSAWIIKMQRGFQKNAFYYLLILRLIPLFPFWLVNIVPALLDIPIYTFIIATFIGIIPASCIYVLLGNGLGHIFDSNEQLHLGIIFEPQILLPLLGLAALTLLGVLYKRKYHE